MSFAQSGLPLCVHMGMSYPPFAEVCNGLLAAHGIGMSLPAQMAFVAIVGHGMLDRYPNLKVGFLEFGAEWMLYMVPRLDHYLPIDRSQMPIKTEVPQRAIEEYAKSGRIFVAGEADDKIVAAGNRVARRRSDSLLLRPAPRRRPPQRRQRNHRAQ